MPNCCRTPIPKCHALMLNFHLSQGLRKFGLLPSNEQQKNLFIKFKGCTSNKICSLACLKAKTGEKPTTFCVSPCTDQKPFWPFLGIKKNIKQLWISNFLLGDYSLMYKKGFCNFFSYLRSLRFFENENCAGCAKICRFFGFNLLNIYLISRNVHSFLRKS